MRRSFAFATKRAPAAALGLVMPLMANVAAAEPTIVPSSPETANAVTAPATAPGDAVVGGAGACVSPERLCAGDMDLEQARAYVLETARPGDTMMRQGPQLAIERLNPEFVTRLAAAIRAAREAGLTDVGVFSAYRPPAFGVGGFKDKFNSLHSYGLAVDMYGIGAPGSSQAKLWHKIAATHGVVCPYGYKNPVEWNHCQPTRIKMIQASSPLRRTIIAQGPINETSMFDVGKSLIEGVASLFGTFRGGLPDAAHRQQVAAHVHQRSHHVRIADARSSRQRQARLKGHGTKVAHEATKTAHARGARAQIRTARRHGGGSSKHRTG